ncbi:MAG: hypothetical protein E7K04_03800 [Helicobacter sp.]|nr:hypothetical protein [Helicobacter sp.]
MNANLECIDYINESEILGSDLVCAVHPGAINEEDKSNGSSLRFYNSYESQKESRAYLQEPILPYIMGGINGGKIKPFLKMCTEIKEAIDCDMKNSIMPIWHDESHFNRYINDLVKQKFPAKDTKKLKDDREEIFLYAKVADLALKSGIKMLPLHYLAPEYTTIYLSTLKPKSLIGRLCKLLFSMIKLEDLAIYRLYYSRGIDIAFINKHFHIQLKIKIKDKATLGGHDFLRQIVNEPEIQEPPI